MTRVSTIDPIQFKIVDFHVVDSGLQVLDSGFFVSETWILDSTS